jgi:hypothetical protein
MASMILLITYDFDILCFFPDQKGSDSVLQECLSCENVPMVEDLLITSNTDITNMKSPQVVQ